MGSWAACERHAAVAAVAVSDARVRTLNVAGSAAIVAALVVLASCAPGSVFLADPALRETLPRPRAFESAVTRAIRDAGFRAEVVWLGEERLGVDSVVALIGEREAERVVLSPLLSLSAADIAARLPEIDLIGFYGREEAANLLWIGFRSDAAMEEAGRLAARWEAGGEERGTILLRSDTVRAVRDDADAFERGYAEAAGRGVRAERYRRVPQREEVRSTLQRLVGDGEQLFVLLLGEATGHALSALREEEVLLGLRHTVLPSVPHRIAFTVFDDLALGVARALESGRVSGRLEVPSTLEATSLLTGARDE